MAIPRVEITVDKEVARRFEEARKNKLTCKVTDFDDIVKDDQFKKRLKSGADKWKSDITKMLE